MRNLNFLFKANGRHSLSHLFITLTLILLMPAQLFAQTWKERITPVPPDVWNFMKYGNVPVNLYTGTVNVSIPVYTYKDNDFEIPVSIDYASGGYIPNQPTGSLGLGWFLNAGGMITREVRDIPDEYYYSSDYLFGYDDNNIYPYYEIDPRHGYYSYYEAMNSADKKPSQESYGLWYEDNFRTFHPLKYDGVNIEKASETASDIFSFNFMGQRGKFHMFRDEIFIYDTTDPQGEYKVNLSGLRDSLSVITITTGDGCIYTFGGIDSAEDIKKQVAMAPFLAEDATQGGDFFGLGARDVHSPYTQWQLKSIQAPNGRKVIFNYSATKPLEMTSTTGQYVVSYKDREIKYPNNMLKFLDKIMGSSRYNSIDMHKIKFIGIAKYTSKARQLDNITIEGRCKIQFLYSQYNHDRGIRVDAVEVDPSSIENLTVLPALTDIVVKSTVNNSYDTIRMAKLNYDVPYPGDNNSKLLLNKVFVSGEGMYQMDYHKRFNANTGEYYMEFPVGGTTGIDYWGYLNRREKYGKNDFFHIILANWGTFHLKNIQVRTPDPSHSMMGMLKRITYPTAGYTEFEYEGHTADKYLRHSADYNGGLPSLDEYYLNNDITNKNVGGIRIKRITNHRKRVESMVDDSEPEYITSTKEFVYEMPDGKSSGILLHFPTYRIAYKIGEKKTATATKTSDISGYYDKKETAPNNLSTHSMSKTHIEYKRVVEKYDDGSFTEYKFTSYEDMPDNTDIFYKNTDWVYFKEIIDSNAPQNIDANFDVAMNNYFAHYTSMDENRGKLISSIVYNADSIPVSAKYNIYDTDKTLEYTTELYNTGAKLYNHKTLTEVYPLKKIIESQYFSNTVIPTDSVSVVTEYTYNSRHQPASLRKVYSHGDTEITDITYSSGINKKDPVRNIRTITEQGSSDRIVVEDVVMGYNPCGKLSGVSHAEVPYVLGDPGNSKYIPDITITHFDIEGNPLQSMDKNGKFTRYIWGYGGLYPVAVIENLPGLEATGNSRPLPGALPEEAEESLRAIRGCMVTTYKYRPYFGITEMTDPSGRKQSYQYYNDTRLKGIFDDKGNIASEYFYNLSEELAQ